MQGHNFLLYLITVVDSGVKGLKAEKKRSDSRHPPPKKIEVSPLGSFFYSFFHSLSHSFNEYELILSLGQMLCYILGM